MSEVKVTQTNGNKLNGLKGCRITVWNSDGTICDQFEVPKRNGRAYCEKYPGGAYGKRYAAAIKAAK